MPDETLIAPDGTEARPSQSLRGRAGSNPRPMKKIGFATPEAKWLRELEPRRAGLRERRGTCGRTARAVDAEAVAEMTDGRRPFDPAARLADLIRWPIDSASRSSSAWPQPSPTSFVAEPDLVVGSAGTTSFPNTAS
jgi:hypothetical protein